MSIDVPYSHPLYSSRTPDNHIVTVKEFRDFEKALAAGKYPELAQKLAELEKYANANLNVLKLGDANTGDKKIGTELGDYMAYMKADRYNAYYAARIDEDATLKNKYKEVFRKDSIGRLCRERGCRSGA